MSAPRIQHLITLPTGESAEAFETFMRERYFPAVHRGATRVGLITSLTLLARQDSFVASHTYLLDMGFNGLAGSQLPRIDDEEVQGAFEEFRAQVTYTGTWNELANLDDTVSPGS